MASNREGAMRIIRSIVRDASNCSSGEGAAPFLRDGDGFFIAGLAQGFWRAQNNTT